MSLFLEKGYTATSTADICEAAHINKPTLYLFFKNKRHLFFLCHMESLESLLQPYLEKANSVKDPSKRLKFMIQEFTKMICQNPELKVLIHETMSTKDQYFKIVRDIWKKHYELLRDTIAELKDKRILLTKLPSSRAALFLLGMMTWITFWFDYEKKESIDEVVDTALSFGLRGLSVRKASMATPRTSCSQGQWDGQASESLKK